MESVKLHGTSMSSFCFRIEMALKLKGIPYEYVEEDLRNKSQSLIQYNPIYKKVPVLLVDGKPIVESLIILEYIDEKWKDHPLLPEDPYLRAKVRFWTKFFEEKLIPASYPAVIGQGEEQEKALKESLELLSILEEGLEKDFSGGTPFFHGERPGFLDIVIGAIFYSSDAMKEASGVQVIDPEKHRVLVPWLNALKDLDVVKEKLQLSDQIVSYVKALRERFLKST